MEDLQFTVPGEPRGKGRPRFYRRGDHVSTYTDGQTVQYENLISLYATEAGAKPLEDEVHMTIKAYFSIPKSKPAWWRAKAAQGAFGKVTRCDIDNVVKAALDGCNGVAFADDSQVTKVECLKLYSDEPRLEIEITYIPLPTK